MNIDISGLDPLSGAVAVVALYIALREARRANEVMLKIQHCGTTTTHSLDENRTQAI